MKVPRASRPSPAMVVALAALVLAMAGTGYAALNLPKNSVGTKQLKKSSVTAVKIKKDAVTGKKVKKASLTGEDIDLAKLGTVPSAQTAHGLAPMEATHFVGTGGEPPFEGGATNFGSVELINTQRAGFYKDHDGIVHLQGFVKLGPGPVMFSLPQGFRPAENTAVYFLGFCIKLAGDCRPDTGGDKQSLSTVIVTGANAKEGGTTFNGAVVGTDETAISLDGISFRAEG